MSSSELAAAVRTVHLGGALLEPTVARKVISALGPADPQVELEPAEPFSRRERDIAEKTGTPGKREEEGYETAETPGGEEWESSERVEVVSERQKANSRLAEPLSRREQEVLLLIAEGLSNRSSRCHSCSDFTIFLFPDMFTLL